MNSLKFALDFSFLYDVSYLGFTSNFDTLYKQDIIKYIESTLKAYMLYFIYENETNTSSKARIIDDIQSIFDEEMTLTELLNKHNINENYKKHELIRRYIK